MNDPRVATRRTLTMAALVVALFVYGAISPTAQITPGNIGLVVTTGPTGLTGTTCPGSGCLDLDTTNTSRVQIVITGTWGGTITFEGSVSGTYVAYQLTGPSGGPESTTTESGVWFGSILGFNNFRARRTVDTFGTPAVTMTAYGTSGQLDNTVVLVTNTGTVVNFASDGTPVRYLSVGTTEDEHAVKTSAGVLYSIEAFNAHATVDAFLKCVDNTTAGTTPGTTIPTFFSGILFAKGGFTVTYPVGKAFSTALTCWIVTGKADSDVAEVAANDIHVNYSRN